MANCAERRAHFSDLVISISSTVTNIAPYASETTSNNDIE
jgi:hypothetical protein